MRRESVTGSVRVGDEGTAWVALRDVVREELVTGRADQLAITPELAALCDEAEERGEAVVYGWPLVVVPGGKASSAPVVGVHAASGAPTALRGP